MNCEQINEAFPDFEIVSDIHSTGWWGSKPFEDSAMASVRAGELLCWTQEKFGHTDERIAFVTHADIKELILEQVHNGPLPCAFNTAVTEVQIATDAWRLVEHNCVAHLPLELHTTYRTPCVPRHARDGERLIRTGPTTPLPYQFPGEVNHFVCRAGTIGNTRRPTQ